MKPAETLVCEYCFVVVKQKDGTVSIANLDNAAADKQPSIDDIYAATGIVQRDIEVQQTAASIAQAISKAANGYAPPNPSAPVPDQDAVAPTSKFKKVTRV